MHRQDELQKTFLITKKRPKDHFAAAKNPTQKNRKKKHKKHTKKEKGQMYKMSDRQDL